MPLIKIWSGDEVVKKVAYATTLAEVLVQAKEKGVCSSPNAKVFLRDWTQLDEDIFKDLLEELPLEERVFIVTEVIPPIPVDQAVPCSSGLGDLVETFHSADTQFKLEIDRLPQSVQTALEADGPIPPTERRELVRSTVDQLTKFCSRPRQELIKSVASAIVLKFPAHCKTRQ
ncbi:uncharacterized protein LOC125945773 [Dermacentor silvarum]|uniref:uncharacterized protein LOC125945773 n=1 Tax=Dermacentor silvarum TaxID=543639 RepID=UPI0021019C54|nr:uncharacterized protein LOC125945773 [Dermacentor silvarum]